MAQEQEVIPSQSVASMESLEAAEWAWRALWTPGQQDKFANIRILDTVQLSGGRINKWLFTSVNNAVKSRKKESWTLPSLMQKCEDPGNTGGTTFGDNIDPLALNAHHLVPGQKARKSKDGRKIPAKKPEWLTVYAGDLTRIMSGSVASHAIVCFSHISGPISFAEITIEAKINSKEANPAPKIGTKVLYTGTKIDVSGSAMTANERYEKEEELSRLGLPTDKLTCLNKTVTSATSKFVINLKKELEARASTRVRKMVAIVMIETTADEGKAVWLHHVNYVDFVPNDAVPTRNNDDDWQERRSQAASEISSGSNTWHRIAKCMGDFCQYPLDEDDANDMIDSSDTNGNFRAELQKARSRHKKDDNGRGASKSADAMLLNDNNRADDGAPLPDEGAQKRLGRKIPFKSIAVCRQDTETWELTGRTNGYDFTTMPWPETLYTWWFRVGKNVTNNGSGAGVPISGAHSIGKAMLGMNPIPEADGGDDNGANAGNSSSLLKNISPDGKKPMSLSELAGPIGAHSVSQDDSGNAVFDIASGKALPGKEVKYDLQENKYSGTTRRSVGQMSWYYSEANVCQTCYYTYRDIDRRRLSMQNRSLKAMKKHVAMSSGKAGAEYDKEIEKKIFSQRKMASRLAAPKPQEHTSLLRSGTSPSLHSTSFRGGKAQAPKGALPPLPWQLRDEEAAREYQEPNKFNSAIVRNIRGKAQGMAQLVQQDRMMERIEAKKKSMMRGGMLDDNSQLLDESMTGAEAEWQQFIGQSRAEFEQMKAAKSARKVTGGLGENRPRPKGKAFDPNRLKHKWQRDADVLAAKVRAQDNPERYGDVDTGAQYNDPPMPQQAYNKTAVPKGNRNNKENYNQASAQFSSPQGGGGGIGMGGYMNNSLAQGSLVSQLTMEPSMANMEHGAGDLGQGSLGSLDGLDDEEWIRAVMVSGKGPPVNLAELSYTSGRSGAKTPNRRNHNVSFKESSPAAVPGNKAAYAKNDDDDDDDDDDDEGVGWSPFVIPT
jgi:hypothetical protein